MLRGQRQALARQAAQTPIHGRIVARHQGVGHLDIRRRETKTLGTRFGAGEVGNDVDVARVQAGDHGRHRVVGPQLHRHAQAARHLLGVLGSNAAVQATPIHLIEQLQAAHGAHPPHGAVGQKVSLQRVHLQQPLHGQAAGHLRQRGQGHQVALHLAAQGLDAFVENGRQGCPVLANTKVVEAGAIADQAAHLHTRHRLTRQGVHGFEQAAHIGIGLARRHGLQGGDGAVDGDDAGVGVLAGHPELGDIVALQRDAGAGQVHLHAAARKQSPRHRRGAQREGQVVHALGGHADGHDDVHLALLGRFQRCRPAGHGHGFQAQPECLRQGLQQVGEDTGHQTVSRHLFIGPVGWRRNGHAHFGQCSQKGPLFSGQNLGAQHHGGGTWRNAKAQRGAALRQHSRVQQQHRGHKQGTGPLAHWLALEDKADQRHVGPIKLANTAPTGQCRTRPTISSTPGPRMATPSVNTDQRAL